MDFITQQTITAQYNDFIHVRDPDPTSYVKRAYALADAITALVAAPIATCKGVGCSYCCTNSEISVSLLEAQYICESVPWVTMREPLPTLANSLLVKIAQGKKSTKKLGDCPFLLNGACSVYQYRPLACRAYFSVDNTKLCRTGKAHNLINVSSHEMLDAINTALQQTSVKHAQQHGVLELRDYFESH